ncbi:hypothetical protein HY632_01050 [Candidatus Uhrbacteria bacterium]|nr:hypothetical protein [Candidatus Uhrbacteria bacterium]
MRLHVAIASIICTSCATHHLYDPVCGSFTGTQMAYERFLEDCEALRTSRDMRNRMAQGNTDAQQVLDDINAAARNTTAPGNAPESVAALLLQSLAQRDLLHTATRLAILPPDCRVADVHCVAVLARIEQQFVGANQCTVIERVRLLEVLHELHYQQNPAGFDEESAVEVGRFVGATHVLLLTVVSASPEHRTFDLSARVVDVEHAIIVASAHDTFLH